MPYVLIIIGLLTLYRIRSVRRFRAELRRRRPHMIAAGGSRQHTRIHPGAPV